MVKFFEIMLKNRSHIFLENLIRLHFQKNLLISAPSAPPETIEAVLLNNSAVYLKFTPPPLIDRNGIIRYYQVKFVLMLSFWKDMVPLSDLKNASPLVLCHIFTTLLLGRSRSGAHFQDVFSLSVALSRCGTTIEQHDHWRK